MKKRWTSYIIAFLVIISINFIAPRLLPGDPVSAIYGQEVLVKLPAEAVEYINRTYGLDRPAIVQYFDYLGSLFKGQLGYSYYHKAEVGSVLLSYLPYSLVLMGLAMVISNFLGVTAGIESGWRRGKILDRILLGTIMFSSSFPSFFVGALFLILLGSILGLLPVQGASTAYAGLTGLGFSIDFAKHLLLPLVSLVVVFLPSVYLLTRNSMVSNLSEPYILLAKAKGLSARRIRYVHAGKNSLIPVATQAGINLGTRLVTGALFVEIVFSYPGMGTLIYNSILNRDYPMLQGSLLLVTVLVLLINFLADLMYVKLDPRIEYAY
ncbi:MAG: ABC transporter permease [Actinomycetota bacterium]|nr:ABC transporter permease [Actinomycetota bacterium]